MPNFNIPVTNQGSQFDYSGLSEAMANARKDSIANPSVGSDPGAILRQAFNDNVKSFLPYSNGVATPYIMGSPAAYETRAQSQSALSLIGNSAAQFFLGELAGGTISGFGTLARPDKYMERVFAADNAWDKGILESLGDWIQESTREKFPIYQTQAAQKGVAWTDATWYASMAPSMASALSILLPARAASIVPLKMAKIISESGKMGKIGKVAELANDGQKLGKYSNIANTSRWTEIVSSAVAGRIIDSSRESLNRYSEYYDQYRAQGMSDLEARQEAGEAASKGFNMSHANIVFDLVEWTTILKMGNYANKEYMNNLKRMLFKDSRATVLGIEGAETVGKRLSGIAVDMFKTGAAEGADEMTMDIFQNEGKYEQDSEAGRTPKTSFSQRLDEHLGNRKNWDSFIGGVAGGLFMLPFGKVVQNVFNKDLKQQMKDQVNTIITNAERTRSVIEDIDKAIKDGDSERATVLKDSLISNIASKSYLNGTLDYDLEMLNNLSKLSPSQIEEQGLNPSIVQFAKDIHDNVKILSEVYTNEMDNIRLYDENGNPDPANFAINANIAQLKTDILIAKKRMEEFKIKNNYDTIEDDLVTGGHFSGLSKEYFNHLTQYNNALDTLKNKEELFKEAITSLEKKIKSNEEIVATSTGFVKLTAENTIKGLKATIDNIERAFTEIAEIKTDLKNKFDVSKKAFDGIDEKGERLLSEDVIKNIETYFNENVKDNTKRDIKNKVTAFEAELEVKNKMLNHYLTREGMLEVKDYVSKLKDTHTRDIESDMDDMLKDVTTIEELEVLKKNIKKTNFDPKTYAAKIKVKEREIYGKLKVEEENAKRTKANLEAQAKQNAKAESVAESSPDVPGNSISSNVGATPKDSKETTNESVVDKAIENFLTGVKYYTPTNTKNFNELVDYINSKNLEDSESNKLLHTAILLDIILSKENISLINDDSIKGKSFVDIFKFIDNSNLSSESTIGKIVEGINYYAVMISDFYKILPNDNNSKFFITGMGDESLGSDMILDILEGIDTKLYSNVKEKLDSYLSTIDGQFSNAFEDVVNEDANNELNRKAIDEISKYIEIDFIGDPENPITLGYNIHDTLNVASRVYRQMLQHRINVLGSGETVITVKDVLKYLRDIDKIYENYNEVLYGLKMYKTFITMRKNDLNRILRKLTDSKRDLDTKKYLLMELDKLDMVDASLNLSDFKENLKDSDIDQFLKQNPKSFEETVPKSGVKAILNTYDEEGNPIEVEHTDITELTTDSSIYEDLSKLKSGTNVEYVIDTNYRHKNSPDTYDWGTQPIRVKVKNADGTSKSTILFIRSLEYKSNGIQYGRLENGKYNFHGMSEVMNDLDYNNIHRFFGVIKDFYSNYRNHLANNKNDSEKDKHRKAMFVAFSKIKDNESLMETFLKVFNQNLNDDSKADTLKPQDVASILNAVFYKVRVEDIEDKTTFNPSLSTIKNKVISRDEAYKSDFNLTKKLRIDVANGTVKEGTIGYVSTPPVLHMDDVRTEGGKILPRYTMDTTIKPIVFGSKPEPRIVLVKLIGDEYYDLETGDIVNDPRFDKSKYIYKSKFRDAVSDNMQVLLETPNGKLIPFDVKANSIGTSYLSAEQRTKAIDTIFNALDRVRTAGTVGEHSATDSTLKHITIDDSALSKERADASTREVKFLETFVGTEDSRITVSIPYKGYFVYVNIVFRNGKVTFYRSPNKADTMEKKLASGVIQRAAGSRFMYKDDYSIDLSTDEGKELYTKKLKDIIPLMLRQSHIDISKRKFTYDKNYNGGEVYDPITETTYKSAKDFYIETGAIYSRANAIYGSNGKIITNFDLRGRSPMTVTLEPKRLIENDYAVNYIEELVGKDKLIDPKDEYLGLVLALEEKLMENLGPIYVTGKYMKDNLAGNFQTDENPKVFFTYLFGKYHEAKLRNDPYRPAILSLAHEMIHTYMNKRYLKPKTESEESKKVRHDNIKYHNEQMKEYYNDLIEAWNAIGDEKAKLEMVQSIFNSSKNVAINNVSYFEHYLAEVKDEIDRKFDQTISKIDNGSDVDYIDTIQEPVTYAYSSPIVTVLLNNINASKNGETFKTGIKNSFWNKLINKFLSILERLFRTDVNDAYKYKMNNKNQLAKLNATVNAIFDARMNNSIIEVNDVKTRHKVEKQSETIIEEIVPESNEIVLEEDTPDLFGNINPEDISDEDMDNFFNEQDAKSFNDEVPSISVTDSVMSSTNDSNIVFENINTIIDPENDIKDSLNLPIC